MCSASELQTILYHVAQAYHRVFGNHIEQILLYGSYARGTNDEESDIDLVAIVHGDRRELQDKLKKVGHFFRSGAGVWHHHFPHGDPV